jgi:hypothetical protein
MPYPAISFCSVMLFALVHLFAERARCFAFTSQARFLSLGSGVAIAYVFIDLLPKLGRSSALIQQMFKGILPFAERHVFIMALLGFLLFFIVDRTSSVLLGSKRAHGLSPVHCSVLGSYALFNFFVGYAVVDPHDPEVQPLALFTFAMGLHYFVNDYSLSRAYGDEYDAFARWLLVASLLLGWVVGWLFTLPQAAVALISAFIGGGVIMNVTRHELPKDAPNSLGAFLFGALFYTMLLLLLN